MKLSRRDFVAFAAGATAISVVPAWSRSPVATSGPGRLSLGYSLYGMQAVPLAEAVAHCARIGYRNIELMLDPGFTAEPSSLSTQARKDLRRQLSGLGLPVTAMMRNLRLMGGLSPAENREAIKKAAELAHDISPDSPPPIETILGGKPADWEETKGRMAGALAEWGATAESSGIEVLIKAHVTMAVSTPERLLWLLQQVPSPKLNVVFDYSHFEPQDISLEDSWAALGSRTKFVHVKDTKREGGKVLWLLPGDGVVDYPRLFRLLSRTGYNGPVVVEVSSMIFRQPGYDPIATAEKCHRFLHRALTDSGVPHD
jgi:inosose dehydratase